MRCLFRKTSTLLKSQKRIILKHIDFFLKILNRLYLKKKTLKEKFLTKRKYNEIK